jgi:hypothetical protein
MLPRLTRFESHSLFWIVLILVFSVFYGISPENNNVFILIADHTFSLPLYLATSYLIAYISIPGFLFRGKYFLFFLFTLTPVLFFSFFEIFKTTYLSMHLLYPDREYPLSLKFYDISLIENYVELQKIRYDDRLDFQFSKKVQDSGLKIVPMVFFTFVENSFKHGSSTAMGKSFIHLELISSKNKLIFVARNSYPENSRKGEVRGQGLSNV